jgi:hypothetical protein
MNINKQFSKNQVALLKNQINNIDLHHKLLLTLNKKINNYPHAKINNKMGSSLNQSIIYSFNKISAPINKNNLNSSIIYNSSKIGIIKFVEKIIYSFFNSLYCIISKPQFINKHNKLIIRIPYYKNNIIKNALFSNTNSNYIYNILNNKSLNINADNLTRNSVIKWLKDFLNLNITKLNKNNIIDFNTINNFVKNDKIIDNNIISNSGINEGNNLINDSKLLSKISNANSIDNLNTKRLSNLKLTSNKLLLSKLINNLNYNNKNSTEILGKGSILSPVSLNSLDKLFGGVYDSKGYLGDSNFINEYKLISDKLMGINLLNNIPNFKGAYLKEINSVNKLSKNKLLSNLKIINNINKKLLNLKSQFNIKNNESINFILANIINHFNPNTLINKNIIKNNKNNTIKLILLSRQLSLINKLGLNLLNLNNNKNLINNLNINNNITNLKLNDAKLILSIKIVKLIIKNNMLFANTLNNNLQNTTIIENNSNKNNNLLLNRIKEILLAFNYYNNKSHNNNNLLQNNITKFKLLGILLSNIFKKNISIELIRLWNVGLDSAIMAQIISKNTVTDKSSVIFKKLWKKIVINQANKLISTRQNKLLEGNNLVYANVNSLNGVSINNNKTNLKLSQVNDFNKDLNTYISNPIALAKMVGVSIKIGGRLSKERIQPKQTVKKLSVGSVRGDKSKIIDSYQFTNKNKRGAYTITIKSCHART